MIQKVSDCLVPICGTDKDNNATPGYLPSVKQYGTVSTATPVTTPGTVFILDGMEFGFLQNCGLTSCYVKYGAGAANDSFNFILQGGVTEDDGSGGSKEISNYRGVVSIFGTDLRVSAWKLS